jgi:hypothetical protein
MGWRKEGRKSANLTMSFFAEDDLEETRAASPLADADLEEEAEEEVTEEAQVPTT